jgi:hypothetical protein
MKDLQGLTDRELLLLTLAEQKRIRRDINKSDERHEKLSLTVEKHEKFKNTLIGAMTTSLVASITAFFKSF